MSKIVNTTLLALMLLCGSMAQAADPVEIPYDQLLQEVAQKHIEYVTIEEAVDGKSTLTAKTTDGHTVRSTVETLDRGLVGTLPSST